MAGKWAFSYNGGDYHGSYDTPEEAIEEAKDGIEEEEGNICGTIEKFYIGKCFEPPIEWCDMGECYIENMQDYLDRYGEWAELFDGQWTDEDLEDLDKRLNATVEEWIKDRNIKPGFYSIEPDSVQVVFVADSAAGERKMGESKSEKRIKPVGDLDSVPHYRCGKCDRAIVMYENDEKPDICPWCGYGVDWSGS